MLLLRLLYLYLFVCMCLLASCMEHTHYQNRNRNGNHVQSAEGKPLHVVLYGTSLQFHNNSKNDYTFHPGETIEFICKDPSRDPYLQWTDSYGISSDKYSVPELRLKIQTDNDDQNLKLSCKNNQSMVTIALHISSTLAAYNKTGKIRSVIPYTVKERHIFQNKPDCSSIVRPPGSQNTRTAGPSVIIINNFEKTDIGTTVSCITYRVAGHVQHTSYTVEREKKVSYKLLLEEESREETLENNTEPEYEKTWCLVGGILGSIILLSSVVISVLWYRKTHQRSSNDKAVIYAEIEDRPPQLPPPRREEQPYAVIMGTLVPRDVA